MTVRTIIGLAALTLLVGCSASRTLNDPRLEPGEAANPGTGATDPIDIGDPAVREVEELVGTQDDAAGYLDDLLERQSVLVDSLDLSAVESDVPDISDSLAAATEARLPSVEEIFDYPVVVNRRVLTWIDVYTGRSRRSFQNSLRRSGRYLPMARRIFAEEGVPQDLAFLGHVESGFRYNARSRARALGLWQFMRGTARDLGLRCDERVEERLDPEKSTRACARYLSQLHERYDDWLLAIAAYNTGPGNVNKAIRRANSHDFWEIARSGHLLQETRNFVPAILAATILAKSPAAYGFSEAADPPLVYDSIAVDHPADLRVIARCAGVSEEEVRQLNPALLLGQTPGTPGYQVRLPLGTGPLAEARLAEIPPADLVTFVRHVVRSGDTLGALAQRYGSTVRSIQDVNGLGRSTMIRVGRTLRIPSRGTPAALLASEGGATRSTGPAGTHTVRRGETVSSIAHRYGVSVDAVARANRLVDAGRIRPGQTLEIPGAAPSVAENHEPATTGASVAIAAVLAVEPDSASSDSRPVGEVSSEGVRDGDVSAGDEEVPDTATALGRIESTAHLVEQARAALEQPASGDSPAAASTGSVTSEASAAAASPVSSPAAEGSVTTHRVARGDTLYDLARRYGVRLSDLRAWNGLSRTSLIRPGQTLRVSGDAGAGGASARSGEEFRLHTVVSGDTLWQIARTYGVAVADLVRWNGLRARARIYPGQQIRVF